MNDSQTYVEFTFAPYLINNLTIFVWPAAAAHQSGGAIET
jgi:hypothetical protein